MLGSIRQLIVCEKSRLKVLFHVVSFLTLLAVAFTSKAQTCFEGDCVNGFGKMDMNNYFYVGSFYNGKFDGAGLRYQKDIGAITMAYWQGGERSITIVEFQNGQLDFGYRTKSESGKFELHNGFKMTEEGNYKIIDGRKYPLDFDFEKDACLLGNCQNGFGGDFQIVISDDKKDTLEFLFAGNYKNGISDGEVGYYEFTSGNYFAGKFLDGEIWNGATFNSETGLAEFYVDGELQKTMSYSIPDEPPGANQSTQSAAVSQTNQPAKKKRGGFWKMLGEELAVGIIQVGATALNEQIKTDAEAERSQQNPQAKQSTSSSSGSNSGGQSSSTTAPKAKCRWQIFWSWTDDVLTMSTIYSIPPLDPNEGPPFVSGKNGLYTSNDKDRVVAKREDVKKQFELDGYGFKPVEVRDKCNDN